MIFYFDSNLVIFFVFLLQFFNLMMGNEMLGEVNTDYLVKIIDFDGLISCTNIIIINIAEQ